MGGEGVSEGRDACRRLGNGRLYCLTIRSSWTVVMVSFLIDSMHNGNTHAESLSQACRYPQYRHQ